jgi:hypothetical protein
VVVLTSCIPGLCYHANGCIYILKHLYSTKASTCNNWSTMYNISVNSNAVLVSVCRSVRLIMYLRLLKRNFDRHLMLFRVRFFSCTDSCFAVKGISVASIFVSISDAECVDILNTREGAELERYLNGRDG